MKKGVGIFLLSLLVLGIFISGLGVVGAQDDALRPSLSVDKSAPADHESLTDAIGIDPGNLYDWIKLIEGGGISPLILKWIFLLLIFALVYSAFSFIEFPESKSIQILLTVVVSLLFMISIRPEQITAIMQSYTAAGIALSLFFPVVVLGFFTFVMAVRVNVVGLVLQRVLWAAYSIYLFVTSGSTLFLNSNFAAENLSWIVKFFGYFNLINAPGDKLIGLILFVSSIIIFFTVVVNNKYFVELLSEEARNAKIMKYSDKMKKAQAKQKADAEAVDEA